MATSPNSNLSLSPGAPANVRIAVLGGQQDVVSDFVFSFLDRPSCVDPNDEKCLSKSTQINGQQFNVQVNYTSGQESYRSLQDSYLRQCHGFVCIYDKYKQWTLDELLMDYLPKIERVAASNKEIKTVPLIFFANETDAHAWSSLEELTAKNKLEAWLKFKPLWVEGNTRTGANVNECVWMLLNQLVKLHYERELEFQTLSNKKKLTGKNKKSIKQKKCLIM
ncbi:Ras-related protein O-RAL [Acrasis kona]|uniref:Ras-related protein O-RAL n=1 Tax=Acrasis kona TaxID=1008807 RepID=A0AAW2YL15_9EUKA